MEDKKKKRKSSPKTENRKLDSYSLMGVKRRGDSEDVLEAEAAWLQSSKYSKKAKTTDGDKEAGPEDEDDAKSNGSYSSDSDESDGEVLRLLNSASRDERAASFDYDVGKPGSPPPAVRPPPPPPPRAKEGEGAAAAAAGEGGEEEEEGGGGGGAAFAGAAARRPVSGFLRKFARPLGKRELPVPEIEPVNDFVLEGFGKSFVERGKKAETAGEEDASASEGEGEDQREAATRAAHFARQEAERSQAQEDQRKEGGEAQQGGEEEDGEIDSEEEKEKAEMEQAIKEAEDEVEDKRLIKVRNLPYTTTEGAVRQAFEAHGPVEKVEGAPGRDAGRPSGVMYVYFREAGDAARAAAALEGEDLEGRPLRLALLCARSEGPRRRRRRESARYYLGAAGEDAALGRCARCGEIGHAAFACVGAERGELCSVCARRGHTSFECTYLTCFNCCKLGHTNKDCPEPKSARRMLIFCTECGSNTHSTQDCRAASDSHLRNTQAIGARCMNCGEEGHLACKDYETHHMKDVFCFNCGERGHQGNECTKFDASTCIRNSGANLDGMEDGRRLQRRQSTGSCFRCGEAGHFVNNCPKNSEVTCYNCNEVGHVSAQCPAKQAPACYSCGQTDHLAAACPQRGGRGGGGGGGGGDPRRRHSLGPGGGGGGPGRPPPPSFDRSLSSPSTLLRQFPSHMPPPAAPWDQRHPQPLLPHQQPWGAPSPGAAPPPPRPSPPPPAARGGRFASPLHSQRFSPHQQGPSPAAYSPVTLGSPDLQRQQQRTPSPLSRQPYYSNAMQPHTGQQGNSLQQQRVVAVQAPPHHQQALQQIHRQLLSQQQPRLQQQQLYTQPTFQGGVMQQSTLPHQQTHTGPHQHQHGAKNWPGASYQQRQHQQRFH